MINYDNIGPRGPPGRWERASAKIHTNKIDKIDRISKIDKISNVDELAPRGLGRGPGSLPEQQEAATRHPGGPRRPERVPGGPRGTPGGPQEASGRPPKTPEDSQEAPGRLPGGPPWRPPGGPAGGPQEARTYHDLSYFHLKGMITYDKI